VEPTNAAVFHGVAAFDGVCGEVLGQRVLQPDTAGWPEENRPPRTAGRLSAGVKLTVTIRTSALGSAGLTLLIEDYPPAGWAIGNVSSAGCSTWRVGWCGFGPFFGGLPGVCTYEATPPANETGIRQFYGTFSLDAVPGLVTGDTTLDLFPCTRRT